MFKTPDLCEVTLTSQANFTFENPCNSNM